MDLQCRALYHFLSGECSSGCLLVSAISLDHGLWSRRLASTLDKNGEVPNLLCRVLSFPFAKSIKVRQWFQSSAMHLIQETRQEWNLNILTMLSFSATKWQGNPFSILWQLSNLIAVDPPSFQVEYTNSMLALWWLHAALLCSWRLSSLAWIQGHSNPDTCKSTIVSRDGLSSYDRLENEQSIWMLLEELQGWTVLWLDMLHVLVSITASSTLVVTWWQAQFYVGSVLKSYAVLLNSGPIIMLRSQKFYILPNFRMVRDSKI